MKKIISLFVSIVILGSMGASSLSVDYGEFSDVDEFDLYYDAVQYLRINNIVQGYKDGNFGYEKKINRAEFLKIVVEARFDNQNKMFLNSYTDEGCFVDVEADKWYTGYICYAKAEGWVNGYGDGSFSPGRDITFVEAAKIVSVVFGDNVDELKEPWYLGYIKTMGFSNLIPLTINDFNHKMLRGEMADMIVRRIMIDGGLQSGKLGGFLGDEISSSPNVTYETISAGEDMTKYLLVDDYWDFDYEVGKEDSLKFSRGKKEFSLFGHQAFHELFGPGKMQGLSSDVLLADGSKVEYNLVAANSRIYVSMYGINKGLATTWIVEYELASPGDGVIHKLVYQDPMNTVGNGYLKLLAVDLAHGQYIVSRVPVGVDNDVCDSGWLRENTYAVDMNELSVELKEYDVPSWKVDEMEEWENVCMAERG